MEKYIIGENSYDIIKYNDDKNTAEVLTACNSKDSDPNSVEYTSDFIRKIFIIGEDTVVTIDGKDNNLKKGDCIMLFKTFRGDKITPIVINEETNSEISKLIFDYISSRNAYYSELDKNCTKACNEEGPCLKKCSD